LANTTPLGSDGAIRKSEGGFLQAFRWDHYTKHLAAIFRRICPTFKVKLTEGGSLWGKIWEEGVDRCKPNFNTIWERERHEAVVSLRKRNLLAFEHNARM